MILVSRADQPYARLRSQLFSLFAASVLAAREDASDHAAQALARSRVVWVPAWPVAARVAGVAGHVGGLRLL